MFGGGYRGSAKVNLTLGLKGLNETNLVGITDELYAKFKKSLEDKGYEVLTVESVMNIPMFEGWEKVQGGTLNELQYPGYASVSPSNFHYMVSGTKNNGKEKKIFLDMGPKISNQTDGLIVIDVNIVVPFSEEAESQGSRALTKLSGGVAKVVAETNLTLTSNLLMSRGWLNQSVTTTELNIYYKKSMAEQGGGSIKLKKSLELAGAIEKKKYKAVQTATTDVWGRSAGLFRVFNVDDTFLKSMQPVPVEPDKYVDLVKKAGHAFLDTALQTYFSALGE
jgi:hypothetical protein